MPPFLNATLSILKNCNIIFQKWGGWSKAVRKFSQKLSDLVAGSFPNTKPVILVSFHFAQTNKDWCCSLVCGDQLGQGIATNKECKVIVVRRLHALDYSQFFPKRKIRAFSSDMYSIPLHACDLSWFMTYFITCRLTVEWGISLRFSLKSPEPFVHWSLACISWE